MYHTDGILIVTTQSWVTIEGLGRRLCYTVSGKLTFFCVFSKVPEFVLVAFKLLEIHWAAFFFAVLCFVFEKKL